MPEKKRIDIHTAFWTDEIEDLIGMDLFNLIFMGKGKVKKIVLGGIVKDLENRLHRTKNEKVKEIIEQRIMSINNKLNTDTK